MSSRLNAPFPASRPIGLFLLIVGGLLGGCGPEERSPSPSVTATADSLAEGYRWLENRYEQMGEPMPPMMRGMQRRMQAMRDRMRRRRDSMMGKRDRREMMGRMRRRMGRGSMMKNRRGEKSPRDTDRGSARMGHGDMSAMHETMARMHSAKRSRMATQHREMARWHERMMDPPAETSAPPSDGSQEGPDSAVRSGASLYAQHCASCHGQNGQGVAGAFPPLADSKWVTGDVSTLARIVLHGLEGPITADGQRYDGVMPAFGDRLSDRELAALLTYLRTSINGKEGSVRAKEIDRIREAHADQQRAWTSEELRPD